jgi:hypothetical protein
LVDPLVLHLIRKRKGGFVFNPENKKREIMVTGDDDNPQAVDDAGKSY